MFYLIYQIVQNNVCNSRKQNTYNPFLKFYISEVMIAVRFLCLVIKLSLHTFVLWFLSHRLIFDKGQANSCLIHFYKRFQIKLLLPSPKVGLLELLRRPVEQQQQQKGTPDLSGHSVSPLVPGGLDNQGG